MKQINKIVKGIVEPKDINVLWLDTNDPKSPILKAYDGEWKAISGEEGAVSYNEQTLTKEQQMQARTNIGAGTYSKPSSNIPKSDLASGVQDSLELADSAVQAEPIGSIVPPVDPSKFAKLTKNGQPVFPVTDVSLVMGLNEGALQEAKIAWDGESEPVVADIPSGVTVTYNSTTYTGTLAASEDSVGQEYWVSDGNGGYDRYMANATSGTYQWKNIGNTDIDLTTFAKQTDLNQLDQKVDGIAKKELLLPVTYRVVYGISQSYSGKLNSSSTNYRMAYYVAPKDCKVTIRYKRTTDSAYNGRYGTVDSLNDLEIGDTPGYDGRFAINVDGEYTTTLTMGKVLYCMVFYQDEFALYADTEMDTVDTVEGLMLAPDKDKSRLDFLFRNDFQETSLSATSTSNNRILQQIGIYDSQNGYDIAVYAVSAGSILHLRLAKVAPAVWQFQNTATMTTSDTTVANYLVGSVHIEETDTYLVVPAGATHLLVCQLPTNENLVAEVKPLSNLDFSLIGKSNSDLTSVATIPLKANTSYFLNVVDFASTEKRIGYTKLMVKVVNTTNNTKRTLFDCKGGEVFPRRIPFYTNTGEDALEVTARITDGYEAKFTIEKSLTTGIFNFNDADENLVKLYDLKKRFGASFDPLILLYFSDIHGNAENLRRIVEYRDFFGVLIDDTIHDGDIVQDNVDATSFDFWGEVAGTDNILQVIGNHDIIYSEGFEHDANYPYVTYFKPYIDANDWGTIVQPDDAEANNLCYYYKDYATQKIRLIVLDNFNNISTQASWLADVLADAITNEMSVVIAVHYMPTLTENFDTGFNTDTRLYAKSGGDLNANFIDAVSSFINNGGEFICWLTGHEHKDYCGVHEDSGTRQVVLNIDCAALRNDSPVRYRAAYTKSQDAFNILSINPYKKTIQMFRVGNDWNGMMKHIGTICIDYANGVLLNTY